ncbi:DUF3060 domain-containing protein [Yinghuangia sp. YIM S10712]|uniref:DUF3060 domain-containing protein n=1 Tax=Yinghuangia sp. YIM S10712 TaxID=3436930 RepID=UPI003F53016D
MKLAKYRTVLPPAVVACALVLGATACDVGMEKDSEKSGATPSATAAPGTKTPTSAGTSSGATPTGPTASRDPNQVSASAPATGTTRPPSSAPATTTATGRDDLVVSADSTPPSTDCTGRDVRVTGEGITITLTGTCRNLTIEGDGNSVETGWFDTVTVTGSDNLLLYGVKPDGTKPAITDNGAGNRILKR